MGHQSQRKTSSKISPLNAISNTPEEKEKKYTTFIKHYENVDIIYNPLMVDSSQGLRFQGNLTYAERNEITSSFLQEQRNIFIIIEMKYNFERARTTATHILFRSLEPCQEKTKNLPEMCMTNQRIYCAEINLHIGKIRLSFSTLLHYRESTMRIDIV